MLALYVHLIPQHNILSKPLYFVVAFTVCSTFVALFADAFWCGLDLSVNW